MRFREEYVDGKKPLSPSQLKVLSQIKSSHRKFKDKNFEQRCKDCNRLINKYDGVKCEICNNSYCYECLDNSQGKLFHNRYICENWALK